MNINDWQTIQTRNYVKKIKELLSNPQAAELAIFVDVALLLFSFLLERIFENSRISTYIWIIILILGLGLSCYIIISAIVKQKIVEKYSDQLLPYDEIIALFDDEVCYKLMSALSFCEQLENLSITSPTNKCEPSLAIFYDLEATYYLNKAISILGAIKASLSDIISYDENTISSNGILSYDRIENVCDLIESIQKRLNSSITSLGSKMSVDSYEKLTTLNSNAMQSSAGHYSEFKRHMIILKRAHENQS